MAATSRGSAAGCTPDRSPRYHQECVHDVALFCAGESNDERKLHTDLHAILMWEKTAGLDHRRTGAVIYNKGSGYTSRRSDLGQTKAVRNGPQQTNTFNHAKHHRHPLEVQGVRWSILEEEQFADYCSTHVVHAKSVSTRHLMAAFLQHRRRPTTKLVKEFKMRAMRAEIKANQRRRSRARHADEDNHNNSNNNHGRGGLGLALVALKGTNATHARLKSEAEAFDKKEAMAVREVQARAQMLKTEFSAPELNWLDAKAAFIKQTISSEREKALRILQRQARRWLQRRRAAMLTVHRLLFRFVLPKMAEKRYRRRKAERKRRRKLAKTKRAAKAHAKAALGLFEHDDLDDMEDSVDRDQL